MHSFSEPRIAGEGDEQAWQSEFDPQLFAQYKLNPEQTSYCHSDLDNHLPINISEDVYQELLSFPVSTSKNGSDHLDWASAYTTGLGMSNPISLLGDQLSDVWTAYSPFSSKSSSPESECSQVHLPPSILGTVRGQEAADLKQECPKPESVKKERDNIVRPEDSRKRSATQAFSHDAAKNDDVRPTQRAKTNADRSVKTRSQLACPFQKLDSHKHHDCLKYALHRIKDVKQHVYRRHKHPDYYCARCFEVFKNADTRDEHTRRASCNNRDAHAFEGISDEQKNRLNKSSSRALDTQGQWFEMWDIIFPDEKRPRSAWVGSYMEEMAPLLRSLWKNKKSSIMKQVLNRDQERTLDHGTLDSVVESIFNCLEEETSASLGKHAGGTCSQEQLKLSDASTPISTSTSPFITGSSQSVMFAEPQDMFRDFKTDPEEDFQNGFVLGTKWGSPLGTTICSGETPLNPWSV
ncbi:hypothetical protein diail_12093 [Diaporthe ilicicola]|nr:hypothetical protein diail_12093 [Diaporthe ilicicola]